MADRIDVSPGRRGSINVHIPANMVNPAADAQLRRAPDTFTQPVAAVLATTELADIQASVERLRLQRAQVERIKWESQKKDSYIVQLRGENARLMEDLVRQQVRCRGEGQPGTRQGSGLWMAHTIQCGDDDVIMRG